MKREHANQPLCLYYLPIKAEPHGLEQWWQDRISPRGAWVDPIVLLAGEWRLCRCCFHRKAFQRPEESHSSFRKTFIEHTQVAPDTRINPSTTKVSKSPFLGCIIELLRSKKQCISRCNSTTHHPTRSALSVIFPFRLSFSGIQSHSILCSEGPYVWLNVLHHLGILNNFIIELVVCTWSQGTMEPTCR